jgi:hypothetical protein
VHACVNLTRDVPSRAIFRYIEKGTVRGLNSDFHSVDINYIIIESLNECTRMAKLQHFVINRARVDTGKCQTVQPANNHQGGWPEKLSHKVLVL